MKQYKPRAKLYYVDVEVSYIPFPSEEARIQAYETHAKLFLRAKERMLISSIKKRLAVALMLDKMSERADTAKIYHKTGKLEHKRN